MSQIKVQHLTFSYESNLETIFSDVSLEIDTDWRLGLIGKNGRGKTTFLNLLMGKYEYSGTITSAVGFEYFPFEIADPQKDTLAVARQAVPDLADWQLIRELNLLRVDPSVLDRLFTTLSQGEQTKVLLAALFLKENRFLLIDEPTNHLDQEARESVGEYLRGKKGFILVSHDRALLDATVDHILSINRADIGIEKGNFSSWQENKTRRDDFERQENERLKKDITRLEAARERTADWSDRIEKTKFGAQSKGSSGIKPDKGYIGHQSARMMKRAKSLEARQNKSIAVKSGLLKNIDHCPPLELKFLVYHREKLLSVSRLSLFYGEREVVKDLSFSLNRGERLALIGKNGCGKSSILKFLLGEKLVHNGTSEIGSNLVISYIPQDTSFLQGDLSAYAREAGLDESLFKAILRQLDFSRLQFEKDISEYSEGQKKKVLLAKSITERAHLYIWDEPLNYIDVISRLQIEEMILKYRPAMIFVEHDPLFQKRIATKTLNLSLE